MLPLSGGGKRSQMLLSLFISFPSEYQDISYVTFVHERIESFTSTEQFRATVASDSG